MATSSSATSTEVALKPTFDKSSLMKALGQVSKLGEKTAKIEIREPMSTYRPQLEMRVTSIVNQPSYRMVGGIITDVAFAYPCTQNIMSYKNKKLATVEKYPGRPEMDKLTIFPNKLDDVDDNLKLHTEAKLDIVAHKSLQPVYVFTNGMRVNFKCDVSVANLQPFSKILVALSSSEYVTAPDKLKEMTDGKPLHGVSNCIKQFEVTEAAIPRAVFDLFKRYAEAFNFPLDPISTLIAVENYKHVRVMIKEKQTKETSSRMIYVPLFDFDTTMEVFGSGAGAMTTLTWNATDPFIKERAAKKGEKKTDKKDYFCWAKGEFVLTQWASAEELSLLMEGKAQLQQYKGEFVIFSSLLTTFKIRSTSLWKDMAAVVFAQTPMVIACNFGLYKTADNEMNKNENESPVHYLEFQPRQLIHDFVGVIIEKGVPCSRWFVRHCSANDSLKPSPIATDQLDDGDTSFLNCNEWKKDDLLKFIDSPRADTYEFFAFLSIPLALPMIEKAGLVRKWAATKKDTTGKMPLCEMLLWTNWYQNPDAWVAALATRDDIKMPADHPLLDPAHKVGTAFASGTAVFFAVDMKARALAEENARKHPFMLTMTGQKRKQIDAPPPTTTKPADTKTSSTSSAHEQQQKSSTAGQPLQSLTITMPLKLEENEHGKGDNVSEDNRDAGDDDDTQEDNGDGSESHDTKRKKLRE
jgi:hypothetical protein